MHKKTDGRFSFPSVALYYRSVWTIILVQAQNPYQYFAAFT